MTIHTDFRKGQRVRVMWKNGYPHLIGHFIEKRSDHIVIELRGNGSPARCGIKLRDVRSINIER